MTSLHDGEPLRVISVIPSVALGTGGTAGTVLEGARAMGKLADVTVYTTDAAQPAATHPFRRITEDDLPEYASEIPLRIFRTAHPYALGFSPGLWLALHRAARAADIIAINSLNLFPQYAAFSAARRAGTPYIVTPHGALDPWLARNSRTVKSLNNTLWQRRMFANSGAIHFTTATEAEIAECPAPGHSTIIVPNGIDVSRFRPARSGRRFRTERLGGYEGTVVLFLGRIAEKKGIDLLIRGFAQMPRECLLVIAGPDDEALEAELRELATRQGVGERTVFLGPLYGDDQLDAFAAADIWALTSHTENFGNAVIEAMAAGCAVLISTEVNLAAQAAQEHACLVTSLDVREIGAQLMRLVDDLELRSRLGSAGRAFSEQFDWPQIAPRMVHALAEVAKGANP